VGRVSRENLQELCPQIHGGGLRKARRGSPLHRTQSGARQIHHLVPPHRQVNLIWKWYEKHAYRFMALWGIEQSRVLVASRVCRQASRRQVDRLPPARITRRSTVASPSRTKPLRSAIVMSRYGGPIIRPLVRGGMCPHPSPLRPILPNGGERCASSAIIERL
jgi:hypothetical protein